MRQTTTTTSGSWVVEYSVDETHDGVTSECGKETFTATLDDHTTNERGADAVSTPAQRLRESCKTCL